jgi:S-layer protein (TIGR01567 family)
MPIFGQPCEIRGQVATGNFEWNVQNFAGFYYDIDDNLGTEKITTTITEGNKLQEPNGIVYTTTAQKNDFEFEDWGSYYVIGFLGEECFAGYIEGSDSGEGYLFDKSTEKSSLAKGKLLKILADDDTERTITSNTPLELAEGYSLVLKAVNPEDGRIFVELRKDDELVDNKMFQPSKDDAAMSDQTYFYRNSQVGSQKNLVTIAVHFKNAFKGADQDLATVDGVWQISDSPISVAEGTAFDKMVISYVTSEQISMENRDSPITLSRHRDIPLAGDISIKTADSDSLRYYIYKELEITESATSMTDREAADVFTGIARESVTTLEKPDLSGAEDKGEPSEEVAETGDPAQRLKALKELMDAGLITEEDYDSKKAEILAAV